MAIIMMIEKFIDWYNDGDGEKKILRITVAIFMAAAFLDAITIIIFNG